MAGYRWRFARGNLGAAGARLVGPDTGRIAFFWCNFLQSIDITIGGDGRPTTRIWNNSGSNFSSPLWCDYGEFLTGPILKGTNFGNANYTFLDIADDNCHPPYSHYTINTKFKHRTVRVESVPASPWSMALPANKDRALLILSRPFTGQIHQHYRPEMGGIDPHISGLWIADGLSVILPYCELGEIVRSEVWIGDNQPSVPPETTCVTEVCCV